MAEISDFEQAWLAKFSHCLDETVGMETRKFIMQGSAGLSMDSRRQDVINWTVGAMERLETSVDEGECIKVLTGCACQYPASALQEAREIYAATGDVERVHQMLQEQFESFLRDALELDEPFVAEIIDRGWGLAGVKQGNTIVATKIPKSGYLSEYLRETDPEKRRQVYCHCPRVRDALQMGETISPTYCYCGAGFYKGVWEEILQRPVDVEVIKTVLKGDDVCEIAITLPQVENA
jgi:predicted hydrocarbon binding protein